MIISDRGRSEWSKCKGVAATLVILLFTPVLGHAESIVAWAKTRIEIKAAHNAAEALANPNVTAKERLRVEQMYYQLVRDNPASVATRSFSISRSQPARAKRPGICPSLRGNILWNAEPRLERGTSRLAALSRALYEPEFCLLAACTSQPEAAQQNGSVVFP